METTTPKIHIEATDNGYVVTDEDGWSAVYTDENFESEFGKQLINHLRACEDYANYCYDIELKIYPAKSLLFPDEQD